MLSVVVGEVGTELVVTVQLCDAAGGRDQCGVCHVSVLHYHWSSYNEVCLSLVESFRTQNTLIALVLYGIGIVGFHAWKGPNIGALIL